MAGVTVGVWAWYGGRRGHSELRDAVPGPGPDTLGKITVLLLRRLLDGLDVPDDDIPAAWLYSVGGVTIIYGGVCHGGPRDGATLQSHHYVFLEPKPLEAHVRLDREPSLETPKLPVHRYTWGQDGWAYEEATF